MFLPKFLLNKRADESGSKAIFYIIFGVVAAILFLIASWMIPNYKSYIGIIPTGLENYLLSERFFDSHYCFAFQEEDTNRVHLDTIDLSKFTQDNLDECYNAADTQVKAYRLTLNYNDEKISISTKNWEGFLQEARTKHISVYNQGEIQRAEILIEVQDVK